MAARAPVVTVYATCAAAPDAIVGAAAHIQGMATYNTGATADYPVLTHVRQPGESDGMWSIEELIAYLGVSYETFRSWRRCRRGPAMEYRFGRLLRFTEEDDVAWLAAGRCAKAPASEPVDVNALYGWGAA